MASYNVDLALVITTECISVQRPVLYRNSSKLFRRAYRVRNFCRFFSGYFSFSSNERVVPSWRGKEEKRRNWREVAR